MADSPTYGATLTDELRKIIKDTAWIFGQMELQVTVGDTALVEVTDSRLITTTAGAGAPAAQNLDLANALNDSIEKVVTVLVTAGYEAVLLEDADPHHASTDLRIMGPTNCLNRKVILSTRRFSDSELGGCILRAVQRHNLSVPVDPVLPFTGAYTPDTVPAAHHQFILLLGQIEVLKMQVMDGVKRRGTDFTVEQFGALASALEQEYERTLDRYLQRRNVFTPEQAEEIGSGQVVQGVITRAAGRYPSNLALSMYSGDVFGSGRRIVPGSASLAPAKPTLTATVLAGGKVKLEWTRSRDTNFDRYEVWRHTLNTVSNISDVVQPAGAIDAEGERIRREQHQQKCIWVDGATEALEAGDYWYRVYVFNNNEDQNASDPVKATVV